MTKITIQPCLFCFESLSTVSGIHEEHLKQEHKIKFNIAWVIKNVNKNIKRITKDEEHTSKDDSTEDNEYLADDLQEENDSTKENEELDENAEEYLTDDLLKDEDEDDSTEENEELNTNVEEPLTYDQQEQEETRTLYDIDAQSVENIEPNETKEKLLWCDDCGMQLDLEQNHNCNEPYQCSICEKAFTSMSSVMAHKNKLHFEMFNDDIIVKEEMEDLVTSIKSKRNLTQNTESLMKRMKRTPLNFGPDANFEELLYSCNQCDYKTTKSSRLTVHTQSIHEGIRYSCNQCDYKATKKSHLALHKQSIHEGIRHFCDKCEYRATTKASLKVHVQSIHEGINYPCPQCDHTATRKNYLKTHIKKNH